MKSEQKGALEAQPLPFVNPRDAGLGETGTPRVGDARPPPLAVLQLFWDGGELSLRKLADDELSQQASCFCAGLCGRCTGLPEIEPVSTALEGGFLTSGQPGKSPSFLFKTLVYLCTS